MLFLQAFEAYEIAHRAFQSESLTKGKYCP